MPELGNEQFQESMGNHAYSEVFVGEGWVGAVKNNHSGKDDLEAKSGLLLADPSQNLLTGDRKEVTVSNRFTLSA